MRFGQLEAWHVNRRPNHAPIDVLFCDIDVKGISKDNYTFDSQHSLLGASRAWY